MVGISVSTSFAAGASPKAVAVRAGHSSVATVLDRYGHLLPGQEDTVNDALDAMAAGPDRLAEVVPIRTA